MSKKPNYIDLIEKFAEKYISNLEGKKIDTGELINHLIADDLTDIERLRNFVIVCEHNGTHENGNNINEHATLGQLSNQFGLSKKQIQNIIYKWSEKFKKEHNVTPRKKSEPDKIRLNGAPHDNSLFQLSLFEKCPSHNLDYAKEVQRCYDSGLFTACLAMQFKLIKALLIELYESHQMQSKILTNGKDEYLPLSELIQTTIGKRFWNFSIIATENLIKFRKLADTCSRNSKMVIKKSDIDKSKMDFRIILTELLSRI